MRRASVCSRTKGNNGDGIAQLMSATGNPNDAHIIDAELYYGAFMERQR